MNNKTNTKKTKTPWPTKDAMSQIYEKKLWGGSGCDFYSGDGSHNPEIVDPYKNSVLLFLASFKNPLIVCDLGCGDFNIGKELVAHTQKYIAVDIVENLIKYNKEKYKTENLEFHCLDIAKDVLPAGDCAIVRQVLQHLSNAEVQGVLDKLRAYQYVVLTEHIPNGDFVPNKDIISGQGIRIKKQSGLDVLVAPFYFKVKQEKELTSVRLPNHKGKIVTTLYQVF
ncbi:class I SAM-dependent methyltransferase [Wenyingzhuangia sp. 2_MG-2023]|uniref:class I SAM-dependent methyltransferase n=1 Tax=Wenyingzhuangia sp. 2_MG-2023 TaxID=3062639 RepID=UPI0026E36168|nr:class I SAM-dependent methyltransferase [Wenyingzhuangia sp. 2_MG-2023]MDO6738515.1 class I SAM-dependent methyltransferase [Wenyingzhuangia sp. 2_MG-2023]